MLTIQEIKNFIDADAESKRKRQAKKGQQYYEAVHDISNYRLFYFNADGNIVEDKTRSNIKISHPFFTELVDQAAQYMLSGKSFIFSDDPKLQKELNKYFNENEDFIMELNDLLIGTMSKGFEYMYAYKKEDGSTGFQCADSIGVVEADGKNTQDKKDYVIYYYDNSELVNGKNTNVRHIMVWDDTKIYYFVQLENGKIVPDTYAKVNPRPHIIDVDEKGDMFDGGNYGEIPFFRLDNNKKRTSSLTPIKPLIDDYDLMACGLSNNIQDASEYLVVVRGFQGDDIEELIQNTKTKKHIATDNDGGVDFVTVDIPYEARKVKLELDEKNIYRFGMGFNSAQVGDGNITNIVIKSRYALLDLKCNKLEIRLKQFIRKLLKLVLAEINKNNGTDYRQEDVYFQFEREIMTNASDNAEIAKKEAEKRQIEINMLLSIAVKLGDDLLMEYICDVLDVDYESIKSKLPVNEELDTYIAIERLNGVVTDDRGTEGSLTGGA